MSGKFRAERVITSGVFKFDGETWNVENNVWVIGDDDETIVIDAAHDAAPIIEAVDGRNVTAIICTHGHNDHVTVAPDLGSALSAPVVLHPGDQILWEATHPDYSIWPAVDGQRMAIAGTTLQVMHTPGHSPGSICLHLPEQRVLFSGDTLFSGGPGATGRSYSDFPTIIGSIRDRLFSLPEDTSVFTGHGEGTSIAAEAPHLAEWIARGY
ncbi:MAG TPA: MBL fold metallo-hydrolase [Mycobacterium sp.]